MAVDPYRADEEWWPEGDCQIFPCVAQPSDGDGFDVPASGDGWQVSEAMPGRWRLEVCGAPAGSIDQLEDAGGQLEGGEPCAFGYLTVSHVRMNGPCAPVDGAPCAAAPPSLSVRLPQGGAYVATEHRGGARHCAAVRIRMRGAALESSWSADLTWSRA